VLKNELAQNAFQTVIAEKNIRPFGQPQFSSLTLDGLKFKCNFSVNKVPEVELQEYKNFNLTKGNTVNSIEMSEKIIQELRNRNGTTVPFEVDDFVQANDTAIINYVGHLAGQREPVVSVDGELFVVGKSPIEAFNDNMLGLKVGETREFAAVIPDNVSAPEFVGKEITFKVELMMASKSSPAALDDTLAIKIGAKDVAEMISLAQGMASKRVQELEQKHLAEQISNRLVANHTFEIPSWLSTFEAQLLAKQNNKNWEELVDGEKNHLIQAAARNVKLSIILDKIRESEPDAQLSDEEVMNTIKSNVSQYSALPGMQGKSDEEIFDMIIKSGYMGALVVSIKDDATISFITKTSTIVE
jgi:trigger factor